MVFEIGSFGKDFDPEVIQLTRKVALLRRIVAKYPGEEEKIRLILKKYANVNKNGFAGKSNLPELDGRIMGPIGLLLQELNKVNAEINDNLEITQEHEVAFNIMQTPWQAL